MLRLPVRWLAFSVLALGGLGSLDAVTVQSGHAAASGYYFYVAPGASTWVEFLSTGDLLTYAVTTQDGANWLNVEEEVPAMGSCGVVFNYPPCVTTYLIEVTPQPANTAGNIYTGSVVISDSSDPSNDKTIQVTMNVTALPIAQAPTTPVTEQLAVGAAVNYAYVTLSNSGLGTLAISAVATSGPGFTATASGATAVLAFDPTGLSPNTYTGSVTIASNAVNSPTTVPVTFQVVPQGPPSILSVVDNADFEAGVAPGDVMALFGQQLSFVTPTAGPAAPLAMQLGGASVFVNGEQAPLYYSSYGQINFQMPTDTPIGTAQVQVVTNGQTSNMAGLTVEARAPKFLLLYGTSYGAIVDASQGDGYNVLPIPSTITIPGFTSQPANPGDVLTIYAIGLGATNPAVAAGQPAPDGASGPLAQLTETPTVSFLSYSAGVGFYATPSYAGLAPHYAGLYQINVAIPANCPAGMIVVGLEFPDSRDAFAEIQVQ